MADETSKAAKNEQNLYFYVGQYTTEAEKQMAGIASELLNKKADKTDLELKADKTYVDEKISEMSKNMRDYTIDFTRADEITGFHEKLNNFVAKPKSLITLYEAGFGGSSEVLISYQNGDGEWSDYKTLYNGHTYTSDVGSLNIRFGTTESVRLSSNATISFSCLPIK